MKSILSLITLVIILSSCKDSQLSLALQAGVKNAFTYGIDTKASAKAFSELKDKTPSRLHANHDQDIIGPDGRITCEYPNPLDVMNMKDISSISKVKDAICSCVPWGNCGPKACDCSATCPDDFRIFDRPSLSDGTDFNNHLNVSNSINSRNDLYNDDSYSKGYCWGIALTEQKFQRLASFQGSSPPLFAGVDKERERRSYYQNIIEKIMNNQPVDIPGFKGLTEFSSDPEVRELLLPIIKKEWSTNAISGQGASIVLSSSPRSKEEYSRTIDDLKYRTENHQSTVITFNPVGEAALAHSVLVNKIIDLPDGSRKACTIDSNHPFLTNQNCGNYFHFLPDGTMNYHEYIYRTPTKVGQFQIGEAEDANSVEQVKNLLEKCRSEKGCLS